MPTDRTPVSAVLITRNAESRLAAALDSVRFCQEAVVVDSGSTDSTVALARDRGARVIHQAWLGFGPQKRFAVAQAIHDWVLCIDADERISTPLRGAIETVLAAPACRAYEFPRCNRFLGRELRHGEGYPDWSLRLFDRRFCQWSEDAVHEKVIGAGPVGRLSGDLMHDSAETLEVYLEKQNRYTTLAARASFAAGQRVRPWQLVASPLARFLKFYVLRRGFLDGAPGLIHIVIGCQNSFAKYAKIAELQSAQRTESAPE